MHLFCSTIPVVVKAGSKPVLSLLVYLSCTVSIQAQTPSDAIMMKRGELCFALGYEYGSFDEYWEGTDLRKNETIATVSRQAIMPMVAIGIIDKLNFYIGVPFIKTESSEPNGGTFAASKVSGSEPGTEV